MAFNDIAIHDGCVAGLDLERYLITVSQRRSVLIVFNLYGVAVFPHVLTPAAAAASGRGPVYCDNR
jgi:Na+-transporting NADH:ubiquinone oxidoreductase subunit NqrD